MGLENSTISTDFDYDLFVIGAGSGGVRAARMAAGMGARVAIAEDRYMGGTCVNVGCVPKKLYVYASEFGKSFKDSEGFGWTVGEASFNWSILRDNKKEEILRLNNIYERLLEAPGAEIIHGRARVLSPQHVEVNGSRFSTERILIATGTWPYVPEFPGSEFMLTSNEIFDLEQFPERLLIIGGGYIATEFAGVFNGLGSELTQLSLDELFMRGFDDVIRGFLADEIRKSGVDLRFGSQVRAIHSAGDAFRVELDGGGEVDADAILCATGRRPHVADLNIECTKVKFSEEGFIRVNEHFQTDEPSIYALGDLIGGAQLTPVALAQGMAFAKAQFSQQQASVDYEYIPSAVFSQPNIGTVGFTENEARERFGAVTIYRSEFKPMKHTLSGREERSLMKLIVEDTNKRVVGVHMVGPDAGEIVQGMAIALRCGATKNDFDRTVGVHPTSAEEFVTMRESVKN